MARVATILLSLLFAVLMTAGALGWLLPSHHHHEKPHLHATQEDCRDCQAGMDALFQDADRRLSGDGTDTHQGLRFQLPAGIEVLRISAAYSLDGSAAFVLRDPLGNPTTERVDGQNQHTATTWKRIDKPLPGTWSFDVELDAEGHYVFGFYFCERAGSACAAMAA